MKLYFFAVLIAITAMVSSCDKGPTTAIVTTEYGDITIELYDDTPIHKENFVKLAKEDFYKDLLFHRVMNGFMIQGGDPDSRDSKPGALLGRNGPGYTIPAEIQEHHLHLRGAVAMARQPDGVNPDRRSSGSQFYIVQGVPVSDKLLQQKEQMSGFQYTEEQKNLYKAQGGYPPLDRDYTVFGMVVEGMEVVDQITQQQVDQNNRPLEDITFNVKIK